MTNVVQLRRAVVPTIVIREDRLGLGFVVTVEPPPAGWTAHPRAVDDKGRAMAHARLLRLEHGWQIEDLCGSPPQRAA